MSIIVDPALQPITQLPVSSLPPEVANVRGTYPGLQVYTKRDSGYVTTPPTDRGNYILRWESLPQNLDQPREEWPEEGAGIEVVLLGVPEEPEAPAPAWSTGEAYTAGAEVTYNAHTYVAQWWTQGQEPGGSPWGAWAELGAPTPCSGSVTSAWTNSWIYTGGQTVAHAGQLWRAQWWTRNQQPGSNSGPWLPESPC